MMKILLPLFVLSCLCLDLLAHEDEIHVVPEMETTLAPGLSLEGPTETKGIGYSKLLGLIPLDAEFPGMDGYVMRMREISLLPGGQVAVHQHTNRPGMAYILEGEATEHRSDADDPVVRRKGDAAIEASGIIHWWINEGKVPAKVVVVDIVKAGEA
jgi:quercetin dioxygenase-like cupin family protein